MLAQMVPAWNPFTAQVLTSCGRPPDLPLHFTPLKSVRHLFFHIAEAGMVTAVKGDAEIRALASFFSMVVMAKVGDYVKETVDIVSCAGFLWLVGTSKQQLDADEIAARTLFQVETSSCSSMDSCKRRKL